MRFILTKPAREDLEETSSYYESQSSGLGHQFVQRFEETIEKILERPESWPKYFSKTRLCTFNQFDYGIVYRLVNETIYVFGVISLIRKPAYWVKRLKGFEPKTEE